MTFVAGLAVILLALLVLLTVWMRRRSSAGRSASVADLPEDESVSGEQVSDQADAAAAQSREVRVLQAQVRTLEQALEEADAATVIARLAAAEVAMAAEAAEAEVAEVADVADVAHVVVAVQAVVAAEVADVAQTTQAAVLAAASAVVHSPPDIPVSASVHVLPDLEVLTFDSDVVLPVPELPLVEARRGHRWFRRSAA